MWLEFITMRWSPVVSLWDCSASCLRLRLNTQKVSSRLMQGVLLRIHEGRRRKCHWGSLYGWSLQKWMRIVFGKRRNKTLGPFLPCDVHRREGQHMDADTDIMWNLIRLMCSTARLHLNSLQEVYNSCQDKNWIWSGVPGDDYQCRVDHLPLS